MRNVFLSLQVILIIESLINSSYTASSDDGDGRNRKKSHTKWTSEMQNAFMEICKNIPSDEPYYFDKIRERWRESHPGYNVSDRTLLRKLYEVPDDITGRVKRPTRRFKWTRENTDELIDLYLNSRPYNKSHPVALREEWKRRYPDSPEVETSHLTRYAKKHLKKRPSNVEGESSRRLFEWTDKQDSDLCHIHHVTLPEGRQQPIHMHRIWTDLHPDYREMTYNQLAERVDYLQKRDPPDEFFPWTKGQNKELLDIYYSTSPEVADQGQRIHEIWSKIHPRYSFMTPYYLQIHASTLAHQEETRSGRKKKYSKLTDETKTNIADMYQRLAKQNESLYDFHKAWVRMYPALAHLTIRNLQNRARKLIRIDDLTDVEVSKGKKLSRSTKFGFRKIQNYTPQEKARLLIHYRQTYPRGLECGLRGRSEWVQRNKNAADEDGSSLRRLIKKWNREESKRKGKALMVFPKVEAESESSPSTSDLSG